MKYSINKILFKKLKLLIPWCILKKYIYKKNNRLLILHDEILNYYKFKKHRNKLTEEENEVINYLKRKPIAIFPYEFTGKYKKEDIIIYKDVTKGLLFVIYQNKRLYFKKSWNEETIKEVYNSLQVEQDRDSPHRYLTSDFDVYKGDVVIDVGAAEGIFSLSVVEKAKKIFIFETDEGWIEPLKITFKPWIEKIFILNKYVSDNNIDNNVTLDYILQNEEKVNLIKIDVDGSEKKILNGCSNTLRNYADLKIVICTYHNKNDAEDFKNHLSTLGYEVKFSRGYMINRLDELHPPYLRRGLIRAKKNE